MANYDQFAAAVSGLSGGKNVVLLDDLGLPSVYVPIAKATNADLLKNGTSQNVHNAFFVNATEVPRFFCSKYENIIINGRAYSLSRRDPATGVTFDQAREACETKGTGFHLLTLAEWAAIALWSRKNGTMPHGNNGSGIDKDHTYEFGQGCAYNEQGQITRTFTGSGPATWGHDHTQFGVQDMNGNVWEWLGGMRLMGGEIQIIPYNNAAMGPDSDMGPTSTLWKGIKSDGEIVEPGTGDTLKYDWVDEKVQLTNGEVTNKSDEASAVGCKFHEMTKKEGFETAPEIARALMLFPEETADSFGGDWRDIRDSGERMPLVGGSWGSETKAGVFCLSLISTRETADASVGFRSAFVEL